MLGGGVEEYLGEGLMNVGGGVEECWGEGLRNGGGGVEECWVCNLHSELPSTNIIISGTQRQKYLTDLHH